MEKRILNNSDLRVKSLAEVTEELKKETAKREAKLILGMAENRGYEKNGTGLYNKLKAILDSNKGRDDKTLYKVIKNLIEAEKMTLLDDYYKKLKDVVSTL